MTKEKPYRYYDTTITLLFCCRAVEHTPIHIDVNEEWPSSALPARSCAWLLEISCANSIWIPCNPNCSCPVRRRDRVKSQTVPDGNTVGTTYSLHQIEYSDWDWNQLALICHTMSSCLTQLTHMLSHISHRRFVRAEEGMNQRCKSI
jgi:hypothetical protein